MIHKSEPDINDSEEVEITGKAFIVRDEHERQRALEATAVRSPVANYLVETDIAQMLDCIKVVPEEESLHHSRYFCNNDSIRYHSVHPRPPKNGGSLQAGTKVR